MDAIYRLSSLASAAPLISLCFSLPIFYPKQDRIVFLGEEVSDASVSVIIAQMLFLEATGRTVEQIAVDTERDYYMSAEEAL